MFKPFYITGLPRSRTAWLSVAFSDYQRVSCLHEPLARTEPDQISDLLAAQRTPFAGLSDSGLAIAAPDLPDILPGPIVIIWRDPEEVIRSLSQYLGGSEEVHAGGVALMSTTLVQFASRYEHLGVDFNDLSSTDTMRQVWAYLLPDVPFHRRRIEQLQKMRIEPDRDQLLDGLSDSIRGRVMAAIEPPPSIEH